MEVYKIGSIIWNVYLKAFISFGFSYESIKINNCVYVHMNKCTYVCT